jgi:hypothetical protein
LTAFFGLCYVGAKERGMNTLVRIDCDAFDWQDSLRSILREKLEVDLVNVVIEYDEPQLEELAEEYKMFFTCDSETKTGFFRNEKLNL